jgi:hypothetical protein
MSILHLTVILDEVKPRVSRALLVPSDLRWIACILCFRRHGLGEQSPLPLAAGPLRWGPREADLGPDVLPASNATLQGHSQPQEAARSAIPTTWR